MSEFNRETGMLTLSYKELLKFHSTADRELGEKPPMQFYVEKLQNFGYEVTNTDNQKLEVKAPANEIVELLSGQHIYL